MQNSCINETPEYAGFWVRLCAYLIDMMIITIPLLILRLILWGFTSEFEGSFLTKGILFQYTFSDIVIYLAQTVYFVGCTYVSGMTIGKKLLNLKVVYPGETKKVEFIDVLFRETVGRFLNGIVLNIGYIFVGLDSEKRGFHDFLSDTRVVYAKKVKVHTKNDMPAQPVYVETVSLADEKVNTGEVVSQTYSYVPQQVSAISEEELWHTPQEKANTVTYSWSQFEYVDDNQKEE